MLSYESQKDQCQFGLCRNVHILRRQGKVKYSMDLNSIKYSELSTIAGKNHAEIFILKIKEARAGYIYMKKTHTSPWL